MLLCLKRKSCIASEATLRWINKADGMMREKRVRTCNAGVTIRKKEKKSKRKVDGRREEQRDDKRNLSCVRVRLLCCFFAQAKPQPDVSLSSTTTSALAMLNLF